MKSQADPKFYIYFPFINKQSHSQIAQTIAQPSTYAVKSNILPGSVCKTYGGEGEHAYLFFLNYSQLLRLSPFDMIFHKSCRVGKQEKR